MLKFSRANSIRTKRSLFLQPGVPDSIAAGYKTGDPKKTKRTLYSLYEFSLEITLPIVPDRPRFKGRKHRPPYRPHLSTWKCQCHIQGDILENSICHEKSTKIQSLCFHAHVEGQGSLETNRPRCKYRKYQVMMMSMKKNRERRGY